MSYVQMQNFIEQAQLLDFNERIQVITYLLGTLQQKEAKKDTSFIDEACGCISDEQAESLRESCGLHFREV